MNFERIWKRWRFSALVSTVLVVLAVFVFAIPSLDFISPTPAGNFYAATNWTEISLRLNEPDLDTFQFNWNGTNYSVYDSSLVLALNLNNNSAIGENATYVVDISKYGNNGTLIDGNASNSDGNTPPLWNTTGRFGSTLQFDGVDDYVNAGNAASLNISTGNISLIVWIKSTFSGANVWILSKYATGNSKNYQIYQTTTGLISFRIANGTTTKTAQSSTQYNDGAWHNVAGVKSEDNIYLYIDGSVVANTSGVSTYDVSNTVPLLVGGRYGGYPPQDFFNGSIDEVRIYNRALNASEIWMQYKSEFKKYNSTDWEFYINITNQTDGTYSYYGWANDTAGNANSSEIRIVTIDTVKPALTFASPTAANNSFIAQNYTSINITASEDNLSMTLRDTSLVLGMHFESVNGTNHTTDFSQYGNNGLLGDSNSSNSDGITLPQLIPGRFGRALQFDGADDYVDLGGNLNDFGTGSFTISLWATQKQPSTGTWRHILASYSTGNTFAYMLRYSTSNTLIFSIGNGSATTYSATASGYDNTNTNYLVGVANRQTQVLEIYLNGIKIANSITIPSDYNTSIAQVNTLLGARNPSSPSLFFNGTIDEVRIYNRALSATEISSTYNASVGRYRQFEANRTGLAEGNYAYSVEAIDQAGNINQSETRSLTIDQTQPTIGFVLPTDNEAQYVPRNWTFINTSISDLGSPYNLTALLDFNRSLVGWWRFNREAGENDTFARDWSTYGNNGTLTNMNFGIDNCTGNCSGWTTSGKFGNALQFDGVNDYVEVGNGTSLNLSSRFTVLAWINTRGQSSYLGIVSHGQSCSAPRAWELVISSLNKISLGISTNGTDNPSIGSIGYVRNNTWEMAAVTVDNGTITIYLNGVLDRLSTTYAGTNIFTNTKTLKIGRTECGATTFNGKIDEVQIYNRALSPEEINASYNAGSYRLYHNFTGLADGTYTYTAYAQDLAGNVNQTETRTLTVDTVKPALTFANPTAANNSFIAQNYTSINITASEDNLSMTLRDTSLVLGMHFESVNGTNHTTDFSQYGNNGLLGDSNSSNSDGITLPQLIPGRFGRALQFDGADDYVTVSENNNSLKFNSSGGTFAFWMYPKNCTSGSVLDLSDGGNSWGSGGFVLRLTGSDRFYYRTNYSQATYSANNICILNVWQYITITFDASGATYYRNGLIFGTKDATHTQLPGSSANILRISSTDGNTYYFNGSIDEVRIYNRALSATEISSTYNASVGRYRQFETTRTNLAEGNYTYYVEAIDQAGNINQTETRELTVDTTPPVVNVTSPVNGTAYSAPGVYFNVSCPGEPCAFVWVDYGAGVKPLLNSGGNWSYNNTLSDGTYTAQFFANDSVGNLFASNVTFEVRTVWYVSMELNRTEAMRGWPVLLNGTIADALGAPLDCTGCVNVTWGNVLHTGLNVTSGSYVDKYTIAASDSNLSVYLNVSSSGKTGFNWTLLGVNPQYSVSAGCSLAYLNRNQPQVCNATILDVEGQIVNDSVAVDFSLIEDGTYDYSGLAYPYNRTFNAPPAIGTYTLRVNVSDQYNNTGADTTVTFEVRQLGINVSKAIYVLDNKGQYVQNGMVFSRYDTGEFFANITVRVNVTDGLTAGLNDANVTITISYPNSSVFRESASETTGGILEYQFTLGGAAPASSGNYTIFVNATDSQAIMGTGSDVIAVSYYVLEVTYDASGTYFKGSPIPFNVTVRYNGTPTNVSNLEFQLRDDNSLPKEYEYWPGDVAQVSEGTYAGQFATSNLIANKAYFLYVKIPGIGAEDKHADAILQTDALPPALQNAKSWPLTPAAYQTMGFEFNITTTDNSGFIDSVLFEINGTNWTVSNHSGNEYYTWQYLPAGTYAYKWYANDSSGNFNSSGVFEYVVEKAHPAITLLLDGVDGNRTYERGSSATISASINASGRQLRLWADFSGTVENIQNGTGYLTNITNTSLLQPLTYRLNTSFEGDENYTSASAFHYLTVMDTAGPIIMITQKTNPLEFGSYQNISAYVYDLGNLSAVLIRIAGQTYSMLPFWWYSWLPLNPPGTSVPITIFANDTVGNYNEVSDSFSVQDTTPPVIGAYSISPIAPVKGGTMTILANISDNYNVSRAWALVDPPSVNSSVVFLSDGPSYSGVYFVQEDGNNTLTIYANDTQGNLVNATAQFIALNAGNITLTPASYTFLMSVGASQLVNFTVNNTREVAIEGGFYASSSWITYSNASFNLSGMSSNNVTLNITIPPNTMPDDYVISVVANSSAGQDASIIYLTVLDEQPPVIHGVFYENITFGQVETISVNASDNKQVDACALEYNATNFTMQGCNYSFVPVVAGILPFSVYVNDTSGNINAWSGNFRVADVTAPNITIEIRPSVVSVGSNVSITAQAVDDYLLGSIWMKLSLPNGTDLLYPLPTNVTASAAGRYEVAVFANDTSGNLGNHTGHFTAANSVYFNGTITRGNGSLASVNMTIYIPNTTEVTGSSENGSFNLSLPGHTYDLKMSFGEGDTLYLQEANLSQNTESTMIIDNAYPAPFLKIIAVNTSIAYASAVLIMDYAGTTYLNEDYLNVYKCSVWDFQNGTCNSQWGAYTNVVQNKSSKKMRVIASSFSAYSLSQAPYCGDGFCNGGESCSACSADCGTCGGCTSDVKFTLENKTIYAGAPTYVPLSIKNTGTCVLYGVVLHLDWTYGSSRVELGLLDNLGEKNVSLRFNIPSSGRHTLSAKLSSEYYAYSQTLNYTVIEHKTVQPEATKNQNASGFSARAPFVNESKPEPDFMPTTAKNDSGKETMTLPAESVQTENVAAIMPQKTQGRKPLLLLLVLAALFVGGLFYVKRRSMCCKRRLLANLISSAVKPPTGPNENI